MAGVGPFWPCSHSGGRELGVVVEYHDQVVVLGRRDLGLDRRQVRLTETGPARPQQVVLAQLQPDRVGAPVLRRRRDLLLVQLAGRGPVRPLQARHRDPVGDEGLAVTVEHLGPVHGERSGRRPARRARHLSRGCHRNHRRRSRQDRGQRQHRARRYPAPGGPPRTCPRHGMTSRCARSSRPSAFGGANRASRRHTGKTWRTSRCADYAVIIGFDHAWCPAFTAPCPWLRTAGI